MIVGIILGVIAVFLSDNVLVGIGVALVYTAAAFIFSPRRDDWR
jgi:hypothetical protein